MTGYRGITERVGDPATEIRANRGQVPKTHPHIIMPGEPMPPRRPAVTVPATPLPDEPDAPPLQTVEQVPPQSSGRTSENLRVILFDTLRALKEGRADPRQALATAKIAHAIIESVKVEIQYAQALADAKTPAPVPIRLAPPEGE